MTGNLLDDVNAIITYSQDYPFDIDCSDLLYAWKEAKKHIIAAFDGELIARSARPIKITLSEEQQSRRFKEFISMLDDNDILTKELKSFLRMNEKGFFDNRVIVPYPSKNIQPGSKLSRSFRKFLEDAPEVRWAQDIASCYIQENKMEGYLHLSIDPRDFLTLSETNAKWTSCQALDGDYRAGNLSYMTDEVTIVAYLASEKQEHLKCMPPDMTWNSKKWRMLIHIGKNCVYYNNQYPFFSQELMDEVYKMVLDYFGQYREPEGYGFKAIRNQFNEQTLLEFNQIAFDGTAIDTRDLIDTKDYLGYCDLTYSSSYAPIMSIAQVKTKVSASTKGKNETKEEMLMRAREQFGIKIGGKVPCVCCGDGVVERDDSFLCIDCIAVNDADEDFFLKCKGCYHRIYPDDDLFCKGNDFYCKSCYIKIQKEKKKC